MSKSNVRLGIGIEGCAQGIWSVSSYRMKGRRVWLHGGLRCALPLLALGFSATRAQAQCVEQQKLTASDADAGDHFGWSVSVSGAVA